MHKTEAASAGRPCRGTTGSWPEMPEPCRRLPRAPAARPWGKGCKEAEKAMAQAEALKLQARLEDLPVRIIPTSSRP